MIQRCLTNILPLCAVHTKCFDSGLTMTYMAPSYAVEDILKSARSIASDFRWTDSQGQGTIKGTSRLLAFPKSRPCQSLSTLLSQFKKIGEILEVLAHVIQPHELSTIILRPCS